MPEEPIAIVRNALKRLVKAYRQMPTVELGPKRIKALRRRMIDEGQSRKYINGMIGVLKSMLRWGMEEELIDASKLNLAVLAKGVCWLRKGRSDAYEPAPVRPVPDALVEKIRDHVAPEVWAMIQFQMATGARPGEVTILRMKDINTTGPVWEYRPSDHKTAHHGKERVVMIGPAGQAVLREFMPTSTEAFVFSPDADGRRPYRRDSYTLAIRRGCELAFKMPKELRDIGRTVKRLAARCAALYCATFDAGGDAMDDGDWGEAADGACFRNFLSGMS